MRSTRKRPLPSGVDVAFDSFVVALFETAPILRENFDGYVQEIQKLMRRWNTNKFCFKLFCVERTQWLMGQILCVLGKCEISKKVRLLWKQFYLSNFRSEVVNAGSLQKVPRYVIEPQTIPLTSKTINLDKIRRCKFDTLLLFHAHEAATRMFDASHDIPDRFVEHIQAFFESRNIHVSRNLDIAMKERVLVVVVASQRMTSLYLQCHFIPHKEWTPRFEQLKRVAPVNTLYLQCADVDPKQSLPKLFRNMTEIRMSHTNYLHSLCIIEHNFFNS